MWRTLALLAILYALARRMGKLTPADFPHLRAYVDEIARCKGAERAAAKAYAKAEYRRNMHEMRVKKRLEAYNQAKQDTKLARSMFDEKVNEMTSGQIADED